MLQSKPISSRHARPVSAGVQTRPASVAVTPGRCRNDTSGIYCLRLAHHKSNVSMCYDPVVVHASMCLRSSCCDQIFKKRLFLTCVTSVGMSSSNSPERACPEQWPRAKLLVLFSRTRQRCWSLLAHPSELIVLFSRTVPAELLVLFSPTRRSCSCRRRCWSLLAHPSEVLVLFSRTRQRPGPRAARTTPSLMPISSKAGLANSKYHEFPVMMMYDEF